MCTLTLGRVVELGAGVGVPGLLAGLAGAAKVILTDYDPQSLHLLQRNIADNELQANVTAKRLDFTQPLDGEFGTFDVVLAADVAYLSRCAAQDNNNSSKTCATHMFSEFLKFSEPRSNWAVMRACLHLLTVWPQPHQPMMPVCLHLGRPRQSVIS